MRSFFLSCLCAPFLLFSSQTQGKPAKVGELVNLRSGPGLSFAALLAIPPDAVLEVASCRGDWCRVTYAGSAGYVAQPALVAIDARPVETPILPPLGAYVWRRDIPPLYDPYDSAGPWYTGPWAYEGTNAVQWRYGFPGGYVPWYRNAVWRPGFGWF
ncbi:SH3 domain-containing protein [Methylosinus sporium]|uniref:SH3 domain-containing protein n=1 Tax=Methylosinus sporium TaxID=428 RepID=UPI00383A60EA